MKHSLLVASCVATALAFAAPAQAQCSSLTTTFAAGNGGTVGGQIFFDLNIVKPGGITVASLDTLATGIVGSPISLDVYVKSGTYAGNETNMAAWTLVSSTSSTTNGPLTPSTFDVVDFPLSTGLHGVVLILNGAAHRYTGTNTNPPPTMVSNADLTLFTGGAQNTPWTNPLLAPRLWNGTLRYDCAAGPPPVVYCTSGTTTNGCAASINANANPKVSHTSPCMVTVSNVEGMKTGIIFYALTSLPQPWCTTTGGTSFLCVKPPTMRTGPQSSGGASGACNGQLVLDWNAFQIATPSALGAPWAAGNKAYVQGWFRDPPACKTTALSNAVELTYQP